MENQPVFSETRNQWETLATAHPNLDTGNCITVTRCTGIMIPNQRVWQILLFLRETVAKCIEFVARTLTKQFLTLGLIITLHE